LQCPYCYTIVWNPYYIADTRNLLGVSFSNNTVGCPECNRQFAAPDVVYMGDLGAVLSSPAFTPQVLTSLGNLVIEARLNNYSPEKFTAEAAKISPAAEGLARFAPKNAADLAAYLAVLLTAIFGIIASIPKDEVPVAPTVVNNYYAAPASTSAPTTKTPIKKGSNHTPPKKRNRRK